MSETMNWEQAKAWMMEHPGEMLVDDQGDLHRVLSGRRELLIHLEDAWVVSRDERPRNVFYCVTAPSETTAPTEQRLIDHEAALLKLHTIGAALDWLIAHPGEKLVDSDGDLWRISNRKLEVRFEGIWARPELFMQPALTWRPAPKRGE